MAQAPLETVQVETVETSQSVPAGTVCRPNNDPYLSFGQQKGLSPRESSRPRDETACEHLEPQLLSICRNPNFPPRLTTAINWLIRVITDHCHKHKPLP